MSLYQEGRIYVAMIQGRAKIGWSQTPARRLAEFPAFDEAIEFVEAVPMQVERRFHRKMGNRSEWYDVEMSQAIAMVRRWLELKCCSGKYRAIGSRGAGRPGIGRPISLTLTTEQIDWIHQRPGRSFSEKIRSTINDAMKARRTK